MRCLFSERCFCEYKRNQVRIEKEPEQEPNNRNQTNSLTTTNRNLSRMTAASSSLSFRVPKEPWGYVTLDTPTTRRYLLREPEYVIGRNPVADAWAPWCSPSLVSLNNRHASVYVYEKRAYVAPMSRLVFLFRIVLKPQRLTPFFSKAKVWVNDNPIHERLELFGGESIVLGSQGIELVWQL